MRVFRVCNYSESFFSNEISSDPDDATRFVEKIASIVGERSSHSIGCVR